jgi:phosphatidylglycerophosphate synthase
MVAPALDAAGGRLAARGVRAGTVTAVGWGFGAGACVAVGFRWWSLALVAWLANRLFDGMDGALARRRGVTDLGGFFDLLADFSVYAGFVVALAIALPSARVSSAVLLFAYYVSATALLSASALLDRLGTPRTDERSLRLLGGLAEGFETMVVYVAITLVPSAAPGLEWLFAAMVLVTATQRVAVARRVLRDDARRRQEIRRGSDA